jgi:hypothetical protein
LSIGSIEYQVVDFEARKRLGKFGVTGNVALQAIA